MRHLHYEVAFFLDLQSTKLTGKPSENKTKKAGGG